MVVFTTLSLDLETKARLRKLAGKTPLARYMREVVQRMTEDLERGVSVATKLDDLAKRLDRIEAGLRFQIPVYFRQDEAGKLAPVASPIVPESWDGQPIVMLPGDSLLSASVRHELKGYPEVAKPFEEWPEQVYQIELGGRHKGTWFDLEFQVRPILPEDWDGQVIKVRLGESYETAIRRDGYKGPILKYVLPIEAEGDYPTK